MHKSITILEFILSYFITDEQCSKTKHQMDEALDHLEKEHKLAFYINYFLSVCLIILWNSTLMYYQILSDISITYQISIVSHFVTRIIIRYRASLPLICFKTPNLMHPHAESDPCPTTFQSGQRRTMQAELLLSYPSTSDLKHRYLRRCQKEDKKNYIVVDVCRWMVIRLRWEVISDAKNS